MKIIGKACLAVVASGVVAAAGTPAVAVDREGATNYVRVKRAWVNPAGPEKARQALTILGVAAMEACGASPFSVTDYRRAVAASPCWHNSMTDVVARIGNPYLTAAFQRRPTVEIARNESGTFTRTR